jgi:hypothetical protein
MLAPCDRRLAERLGRAPRTPGSAGGDLQKPCRRSVEALTDLKAFFERSEELRDHAKLALHGAPDQARIDLGMRKTPPLALAIDLAIKIDHGKQDERTAQCFFFPVVASLRFAKANGERALILYLVR